MTTLSPVKTFVSYSHEDRRLVDKLARHLSPLTREGLIDCWYDHRITAGAEFSATISQQMEVARIILLAISPDFIASDYCYNVEMKRALQRHAAHQSVVIPVILRPVHWQGAPFARLLAVPHDAKPVTEAANRDSALRNVATHIRQVAERITIEEYCKRRIATLNVATEACPELERYLLGALDNLDDYESTDHYWDDLREQAGLATASTRSFDQQNVATTDHQRIKQWLRRVFLGPPAIRPAAALFVP